MKSILLTSPSSSSTSTSSSNSNNNLPLLVGTSCSNSINNSHNRKYKSDDDKDTDNSVNETVVVVDKQEFTNKLLSNSNTKSQVIKSKIIAKNNDKLRHSDNKNIFSNADYERWQKKNNNNNLSDVNSDCFSLNLENHPLIDKHIEIGNESDNQSRGKIIANATAAHSAAAATTKLINLRKKNGTALIFQRKISSQQQKSNCEYQDLEIESFKKRQSLQWPQKAAAINHSNNNKTRHYSWYDACNYTREPIEEEFENSSLTQFTSEHNNLAEIKTIIASSLLSIESDENVPEDSSIEIMKTSSKDNSTPPTTGASSKRWHNIEQFLKNLVGKRSSSSTSQVPSSTINTTTTTTTTIPATTVTSSVNNSPSAYDLFPQQKSSICGSTISLSNKDRLINKSTASLNSTSLALVHQKLWSVVPLLSRKDGGGASCINLLSNENSSELTHRMRKCETVLALTNEPRQRQQPVASTSACNRTHSKSINNLLDPMPMQPLNRLRNSQSCYVNCDSNTMRQAQNCSRCSSLLSLAAIGGSSYSLTNGAFVLKDCKHSKHTQKNSSSLLIDEELLVTKTDSGNHNLIENDFNSIEPYDTNEAIKVALATVAKGQIGVPSKLTCKLCLGEYFSEDKLTAISSCGCIFCTECMRTYVEFEISEGAYELSCPDALCSSQGVVSLAEISQLASASLVEKHHRYRLNREVELDKYRLWCPNRNCETICSIPLTNEKLSPSTSSQSAIQQQPSSSTAILLLPRSVLCPTCNLDFCSSCKKAWHPSITCEENSKRLGSRNDSMLFDNDLIKNCPMCAVPIERHEGCAQMMCKRCKHVFCWYCLASLDDDFLLRHYDKGPCKNKLGHSRASVVWHRAQVIGIFAGFGILLLVASPLLLLAAPCIVCCKCKIEESTTAAKLDEPDHHSDHQV